MSKVPRAVEAQNPTGDNDERSAWDSYKRRLFLGIGLIAFLFLLGSFIQQTVSILLLVFLCILVAVGIRGLSDWLANHTFISKKIALSLVMILLGVLFVGGAFFIGPRIAAQFSSLTATLSHALDQLDNQLRQYGWGQDLLNQVSSVDQVSSQLMGEGVNIFTRITGIVSQVVSILSFILVGIFLCLYFAIDPKSYSNNFLHLIPFEKRDRVSETLGAVSETLRKWLLTRAVSMIFVGIVTLIALQLLGMPLVLSLALIAALGSFIPTFGPILALIPAALVALIQSPQQALIIVVLYTGIQMVDNYILTPITQKTMLYLPPAYIVVAQLIFGALTGPLGLVLAAPLAAALVVVVRMLYVEDVLGDDVASSDT